MKKSVIKNKSDIEAVLLKGLKNSKHDSFKKLFDLYSVPLYRFSNRYLKSDQASEDVVQEVFIKVWDKRKEIDTTKSFQAYLFTIALNAIRKQFNNLAESNQMKHDILLSFTGSYEDLDDMGDFQNLLDRLDYLINQMPEKRRNIFLKKKIERKSLKEIASEYNMTTKAVEYHITEAIKFLKKGFEKHKVDGMILFCLFFHN